jgi:hypothetical protein
MRFLLKTLLLSLFCAGAHAQHLDAGLWYDPARPGSGLSLHRSGTTYFASVFEYDANSQPIWYFASNVTWDGSLHLDPGGPIYEGKLYTGSGTPMMTREHQFFAPVEVGKISMWQFQFQQFPTTLIMSIYFPPLCPTCELRVVNRSYVRLM